MWLTYGQTSKFGRGKIKSKSKRKKGSDVWQLHHTSYDPERTVVVTRAEHYFITRLNLFKAFSLGAREAIKCLLDSKPIKYKDEK